MKTALTLFRDFLFIALLGFMALVVWMLPHLNPPTDSDTAVPPGNLSITAVWPDGPIDVDVWILAPGDDKPVGYSRRGGKVFNLLRDDLGTTRDALPVNIEHAYSRGLPSGAYVINVHCYRCSGEVPVIVEVRKGEFGRRQALLFQETVVLRAAQEKTVVRFKLDGNGDVIPGSVDHVDRPLRSKR